MTTPRETPHYALVIEWDPQDAIYVVSVPELPGCMTHGHTYEEAIRQAEDAIATWVDGALEDGEELPTPRAYPRVTAAVGAA